MEPQMALALRNGPFHHALRIAIKSRGLSLQRLRVRLAEAGVVVGVATLSSWQSGQRRPERADSLRAVAALEDVLGLTPRSLLVLLGPPRPRGPVPQRLRGARRYLDLMEVAEPVVNLIDQLEGGECRLRTLANYDGVCIGAGGTLHSLETTQVLRAEQATDRMVVIYNGERGSGRELDVRIHPLGNCRVGLVQTDPANAVVAIELLLDQLLEPGDTQIVRYRLEDRTGSLGSEYHRWLRYPAQHLSIDVRFDPDFLPLSCWRYSRQRAGEKDQLRQEVQLGPHRTAHLVMADPPAGMHGIGWSFL